ncbi:MAG TPA: metal-sulfur cluster assembly factor, partial [Thermodesulfobacteriota bacterium]
MKKIPIKKEVNAEGVTLTTFEKPEEHDELLEITEETVLGVLKGVRDPEIPIDIVNLGLIYDVGISGKNVHLKMTLTTPGCGMGKTIAKQAEGAVKSLGVKNVLVEIVW